MKTVIRPAFTLALSLFVTAAILPACSSNDGQEVTPLVTTPTVNGSDEPRQDVTFTIGNLSDQTGPSAAAMQIIDTAFGDLIRYFNEENLIPGIELKMVTYDGQYDPSKDIPGYEWLKERGADVIWTPVPAAAASLKHRADEDNMIVFVSAANMEQLEPPGYVFSVGTMPQFQCYTFLKWIVENDWDYAVKGPAQIGGAGWNDTYFGTFFESAKDYCEMHPDQYEWVDGHLTDLGTFSWGPEVESLKDCDYVFTPNPMINFVKEFRAAGYTARFIGTDNHCAFFGLISDAQLWDEIDGMLFLKSTEWWNDEGEMIDLIKDLLLRYHPGEADKIVRSGVGYISMANAYQVLTVIQDAAEAVGVDNLDTQSLYEAAQAMSISIDGLERFTFSDTKRYSANYYAVYEADGTRQDIFRIDPKWHLQELTP